MRILVLGGGSFVGRTFVELALTADHDLTLFSRGRTGTDLFPDVERCRGDRATGDYAALDDGEWDAVVDVSGYVPRHVRQAADALGDRIGRYLFVSTGSVYDVAKATGTIDEDSPRLAPERDTEEITDTTYGPLKVACEDDVLTRYGERATVVRPGVVAGPYDPTDRFTWWVRRAARGGRVELPGRPDQPVQVVDSGDLAGLMLALLTEDRAGTYDAVGPAEPTTLDGLIRACAAGAGTTVDVVPVDPDDMSSPLPLVLDDPSVDPLFRRTGAAARAAGMPTTPLPETAAAVLEWDHERGEPPLAGEPPPK
jgi:2'-hydroxyisoflavone reductase